MIRGRRLVALALLLATASAASGCVKALSAAGSSASSIDVITGSRGLTLNPYSAHVADRRIGRLLFRGLMTVGKDGMPVADLATEVPTVANGGISGDGKTVTYHIREGVRWHDGKPLTAGDVAFTIELVRTGRIVDDPAEDLDDIVNARAVDDRTVVVTFKRADSVLAWRLAPYVLPQHLLGKSVAPTEDSYWAAPVGSGPYRVAATDPDGTVDLEPAASASKAPKLRIRPLKTQTDAARAFDTADHVVWLDAPVDPEGASESLDTTYGQTYRRIVFNTSEKSSWRDERLREAISLMTTQTVPSDMPASAYPYGVKPPQVSRPDTRAASAIFEELGWTRGKNGERQRDGKYLQFMVGAPPLTQAEGTRFVDRVAKVWNSSGLRGDFYGAGEPYRPTWNEGGVLVRGERDAFMIVGEAGRPFGWAWPFSSDDTPSWQRPWGLNIGRFSDAGIDAAFQGVRTAPDPQTARRRLASVGRQVYATHAELYIEPIAVRVLSKGVTGVQAWPIDDESLTQAPSWRLPASNRVAR